MQMKTSDGYVILSGIAGKNAVVRDLKGGEYRKASVSLAIGKRDDKTVWADVEAWGRLSSVLGQARKGDSVLAIGQIRTNTYKGKEQKVLNCEFVSVAGVQAVMSVPVETPAEEELGW